MATVHPLPGLVAAPDPAVASGAVPDHVFRALVEGTSEHAIYMLDGGGRVATWNAGAAAITGWGTDEVLGKAWQQLFPCDPLGPDPAAAALREATRAGRCQTDGWRQRKDGTRYWVTATLTALLDESGRLYGFAEVARDTTDRFREQTALRHSEERHRSLVESLSSGVVVQRGNGRVIAANSAACAILGLTEDELLGRTSMDPEWHPMHEDGSYWPGDQHPSMQALATGQAVRDAVMGVRRKDGHTVWILINSLPADDPVSGARSAITSFVDITGRVDAETRMRRANADLTRTLADMQARDVRNHALHDMGEMLQNCTSVGEAWAVLKRYMPRLLPAAAGRFHASQGHEPYEVAVGWGDDASGTFALGADDCWALRLGRAHVSERGDALRCGHLPPDATRSHLCVPVSGQGRTVGLLHFDGLEHREDAALLHDTLLAWGTTIAENLGLALSNLELREKLRVQAMRDALTGLYNRRYLEEALARELRRSARSQRPLSLLIVDIDHFKQVNDRHGHDVGDEVLCAVAHLLESTARAEDVVCRLGGEEFVVISPEADVGGGAVLAERLRGAVRALEGAALPAALTQPVTVSIGVASAPQHAADAAALLKAADAALYDAKRAGRDRVGLATGAAGVV